MTILEILIFISYFFSLYFIVYWFLLFFDNYEEVRKEREEKTNLSRFPLVSVIVPAYNEEKTIKLTLTSLIHLDWPTDKLEIIVINDGSKDKTKETVEDFISKHSKFNIQLINQKNKGKGSCLNKGLKLLKGEIFACLDADSYVESKILRKMVFKHLQDPQLAIVTPVMKISTPKTFIQKLQRIEYISNMFLAKLLSYIHSNYVAPGPFSTYKTHIIRKVGGFDETNLVEDQEIAFKIQKHHYKIIQALDAVVYTKGPHNLKAFNKQRNRWYKGTILNLFNYKNLMFKKKYGDFGVFQLPIVNLLYFSFAILALVAFYNYALLPIWNLIRQAFLIQFDFLPFLSSISFEFDILKTKLFFTLILVLSFLLMLTFFFLSSKINKDDLRPHFIYILPFFFIYFLIVGFVVLLVLFELLIGKKQKW